MTHTYKYIYILVAQAEWRAAKKPGEPYWVSTDPEFKYLDPELTELGVEQAKDLQSVTADMSPELIIVSPMRRAIQTALIGFESHVKEMESSTRMMKILAHESAHEIAGKHTCDKRLSKSELIALYPMIDFNSHVVEEEDPYWGDGLTRESHISVASRAANLMEFIRSRTENEIVVAAHSTILFSLMNAVVIAQGENADYDISWFGTGEMRSFYVQWESQEE
jgi:glucosyl-3-phosphoglycerate phosphatase